jgi:hypothetical protein
MAVTVTGQNGGPLTITTGPGDVLNLASQIGVLLSTIQGAGNLSVTTDTQPGPIIPTADGFLHGSSDQYRIIDNGGSLSVTDTQSGRDGTQILSAGTILTFTDGVGIFDPTGTAENISRLYQALLGRSPDVAGLQAWTNLIDNSGASLTDVANALASSAEYQQAHAGQSDSDFVNSLYLDALGRSADPTETQEWANAIASGTSRGAVAIAIAESDEGRGRSLATAGDNNDGEVFRLYQTVFGRSPDAAGAAAWSAALSNGATITQVAQAFVDSPEFQQLYGSLPLSDFIAALYRNALGRDPSPTESQGWVDALNAGASEASVVVGFSDSIESRGHTADATHANWVFLSGAPTTTNQLLLNGSGGLNSSVPGGYHYIVVNDGSSDTLTASNAAIVTNTIGGAYFVSGISTVAATGGDNTVNASGTYDLSFGPGNNLVVASGSGTIATGLGSSTVVAANTSGSGNLIDLHGTDLVNAALGSNTINASGSSDTIIGGVGNLTVNFVGAATAATVFGGSGGSTIFGGANSNVAFNGPGDLAYSAAAGSVTLNAAAASGNLTATLGAGSETLTGGTGTNQYNFIAGAAGATDVINDTSLANDTFSFTGYSNPPTQAGLTLTLSDNTTVTFTHVTDLSQLHIVP